MSDECEVCGVGFRLPSGVCDHCDSGSNPKVSLKGGTQLTADECRAALDEAMTIIEAVGTTGIYSRGRAATAWMKKYYPNWA